MGNGPGFESEVLALLSALKLKKEELQKRHKLEMEDIDRQIDAVSTTAALLRNSTKLEVQVPIPIVPDLHGTTIREGCVLIAQQNNGMVRVKEAKDALISARVLRKTKNSWAVVSTTLERSKEFAKHPTERGTFVLVENGNSQALLPVAS